jgi:hypothetical protein
LLFSLFVGGEASELSNGSRTRVLEYRTQRFGGSAWSSFHAGSLARAPPINQAIASSFLFSSKRRGEKKKKQKKKKRGMHISHSR